MWRICNIKHLIDYLLLRIYLKFGNMFMLCSAISGHDMLSKKKKYRPTRTAYSHTKQWQCNDTRQYRKSDDNIVCCQCCRATARTIAFVVAGPHCSLGLTSFVVAEKTSSLCVRMYCTDMSRPTGRRSSAPKINNGTMKKKIETKPDQILATENNNSITNSSSNNSNN